MMNEKPGVKTSEFWLAAVPAAAGFFDMLKADSENGKYLLICGTVLSMTYILSRTFIKVKK
jgi:hypothetical protein